MGNEIATSNQMTDIMNALQNAAYISENTSRQMGLLNERVAEHDRQLMDLTHRMEVRESRETVDRDQADRIRMAVHDRVYKLLEIERENGHAVGHCIKDYKNYFRPFVQSCYGDCKAKGRMGKPYWQTLAIDYDDVITFINSWFPRGGVNDYKNYLDNLHEDSPKK